MDLFDLQQLNNLKNDGQSFVKLSRRIRINAVIAGYYQQLGNDYDDLIITRGKDEMPFDVKMSRRAGRLLRCGRLIDTTRWKELGIHKVNSLQRCGDKFCGNCQKQLANAREHKYEPLLKAFSSEFDLYHITLTVPNVSGRELPKTVDRIISAFGKFVKFLLGRKNIRGLNISRLGCLGAIRSMEITMNKQMTTYHPHLHVIAVFKKGLELDKPKVFTNDFSYSYGRKVQQFSAFEVLIQKLWACCYSGVKITKRAVESSAGYSCIVNNADGNYHQIFKYAIAGLLADKKKAMCKDKSIDKGLTYKEFHDLYFALENRRAMQGYGIFYGLKFDDSILTEADDTDKQVKDLVCMLNKLDDFELVREKLSAVIENITKNQHIYFSKKSVGQALESLKDDD
ncbi:MAG: protein rep [Roseburia sp.]|nr:protein rep [Roseburia sp.]